jgi:1,2-diacylglycerol 3-alpha-glucosyltransferase
VRIAQVVPRGEQPASGVLTVIVELSVALSARGHHVELWQLHSWASELYGDARALLAGAGVREIGALADVPRLSLGRVASELARTHSVDVVHLHSGFTPSNTAIARRLRTPYLFSPHSAYDPVSLRRNRRRKLLYRALFERSTLNSAALIPTLTDAEAVDVRAFGTLTPTVVIPNGVTVQAAPDGAAFRSELGIPSGAPLAVFVGRLDVFRKGLAELIRALAEAKAWRLILVGPRFRDVEGLERLIDELGVGDRVRLAGERHGTALRESLQAADVFVLPSRWEGMPMALLEALAIGTPAIVSPEVDRAVPVQEAGAGWAVPRNELGAAFRRIEASDPADLAARGTAAAALARRYDWRIVAERYEAAYERAIGDRKSVPQ